MTQVQKLLRNRFISDNNLPFDLIDDPYFVDRLHLVEDTHKGYTKWVELNKLINDRFDNNMALFTDVYYNVRNDIVNTMLSTDEYKDFSNGEWFLKFNHAMPGSPGDRNVYTQEQDGCIFLSVDMKKANFYAMRHFNKDLVFGCDTYEDFIGKFTDLDYIKNSKYTRQVIYGKLNPKRTMAYERLLVYNFFMECFQPYLDDNWIWFSLKYDEILIKLLDKSKLGTSQVESFLRERRQYCNDWNGIKFGYELFKLNSRIFEKEGSMSPLVVFEKEHLYGDKEGQKTLHCVPATYYPQVYKLLNGMGVTENDLVFKYEHELAKFLKPLTLKK